VVRSESLVCSELRNKEEEEKKKEEQQLLLPLPRHYRLWTNACGGWSLPSDPRRHHGGFFLRTDCGTFS
jgi:hypothetical protein